MKNYIQAGDNLTVTVATAVTGGAGVLVGAIFGVAQGDAAAGEDVVLVRRGVFELDKAVAEVWTAGEKVYWDADTNALTTTAVDNLLVGATVLPAANPSGTGVVLLDGVIR
ncbi:DUF2190 family protein [Paracoccus sp. (in: a-proteobacteria)]|uniref:DUF2190 family protein n=1 Tax=Paracoccus sp. TaxID=267 RepID=UPI00289C777E|nr:DUF2190 family protein [Paracoccus sp. (in: a-proteobacteria)]